MNNTHILWAINKLNKLGFQLQSLQPAIIQNTPWSEVSRFSTDRGYVFLKKVPQALFLEASVIRILSEKFTTHVPHVIAENQELHCFIMQDAGIRLYDYFKNNFVEEVFIQVMHEYAELQIKVNDNTRIFLEMGVPDWGLNRLPGLYDDLIAEKKLLIDDGLTADDMNKLENLKPELVFICENLSRYNIQNTFGHADFHDKNILINTETNQTTIIDLGEVVITHPFFSFHNCLHMVRENCALSDEQYISLQNKCLKPWFAIETQEHLIEILTIIQQCWSIHAVLGEYRLIKSVNPSEYHKLHRKGRFSRKLQYWLSQKFD